MVFPVVMYGCDSWTVKKAEHWRIYVFELWCWRRLLRVPWTARRSNQSILKQISPGCSLEGLMLKLKLQYLGYLMQRADSFEKTLVLGKIEDRRRRRWQRIRWFDGITDTTDNMGLVVLQGLAMDREAWHAALYLVSKSETQVSDWSELRHSLYSGYFSNWGGFFVERRGWEVGQWTEFHIPLRIWGYLMQWNCKIGNTLWSFPHTKKLTSR